jgi:hypothetical protein
VISQDRLGTMIRKTDQNKACSAATRLRVLSA